MALGNQQFLGVAIKNIYTVPTAKRSVVNATIYAQEDSEVSLLASTTPVPEFDGAAFPSLDDIQYTSFSETINNSEGSISGAFFGSYVQRSQNGKWLVVGNADINSGVDIYKKNEEGKYEFDSSFTSSTVATICGINDEGDRVVVSNGSNSRVVAKTSSGSWLVSSTTGVALHRFIRFKPNSNNFFSLNTSQSTSILSEFEANVNGSSPQAVSLVRTFVLPQSSNYTHISMTDDVSYIAIGGTTGFVLKVAGNTLTSVDSFVGNRHFAIDGSGDYVVAGGTSTSAVYKRTATDTWTSIYSFSTPSGNIVDMSPDGLGAVVGAPTVADGQTAAGRVYVVASSDGETYIGESVSAPVKTASGNFGSSVVCTGGAVIPSFTGTYASLGVDTVVVNGVSGVPGADGDKTNQGVLVFFSGVNSPIAAISAIQQEIDGHFDNASTRTLYSATLKAGQTFEATGLVLDAGDVIQAGFSKASIGSVQIRGFEEDI